MTQYAVLTSDYATKHAQLSFGELVEIITDASAESTFCTCIVRKNMQMMHIPTYLLNRVSSAVLSTFYVKMRTKSGTILNRAVKARTAREAIAEYSVHEVISIRKGE